MKLQDAIPKATVKKISWLEAAEIIGVCDRTMRRMREEYQKFGYTGLRAQGWWPSGASVGHTVDDVRGARCRACCCTSMAVSIAGRKVTHGTI